MAIQDVKDGKHETRSNLLDLPEDQMEAAGGDLDLQIEGPRRVDFLL
jgi:hypothetical protein